jgi:hypothetical protein
MLVKEKSRFFLCIIARYEIIIAAVRVEVPYLLKKDTKNFLWRIELRILFKSILQIRIEPTRVL